MTSFTVLQPYLPTAWVKALTALPSEVAQRVQEVRLRADAVVTVSLPEGERCLGPLGISALRQADSFYCTRRRLERCFVSFCQESVYAHQWELSQGYIAVPGGIRVGVAGTAVITHEGVQSVRDVGALCIRFPRRVAGCAHGLVEQVLARQTPTATLVVGAPACGKTTLLREASAALAAAGYRVAVVDERGELAVGEALRGCDVLRGYPKAVGIRQAVRCLAPDCIVLDELGDGEELQAVADCAHAGVAVLASLHGDTPRQLERQPFVQELVRRRVFARWVFLAGRDTPGQIRDCYVPEVTPYGMDWRPAVTGSRRGTGAVCLPPSAAAGGVSGAVYPSVADLTAGDDLHGAPYKGFVAAVGAG